MASYLKHMIFGRSTEKKSRSKQNSEKQGKNTTRPSSNRNRGHQPGTQEHGRRKHENLPVVDQEVDLPETTVIAPLVAYLLSHTRVAIIAMSLRFK
ncbi:hypothetical protein ACTL6P_18060 [Endozoicomonas acroporae]|uniref:hypothetical protein n=1 Tax=Endozoicomonas acroporae TaxID=1701104 RepID=UPI000C78D41A|nr:hypothetical protein [Endozoicomonas acroporae]